MKLLHAKEVKNKFINDLWPVVIHMFGFAWFLQNNF